MDTATFASLSNDGEPSHDRESLALGILFVTLSILVGGTFFMSFKHAIALPYTVVLFLYGIVVGALALWLYPDVAISLGSMPPDLLFAIFLPVLIFEGSYGMNIHALKRVFWQTLILATIGIMINTLLIALAVKAVFWSWSWYAAMLLGSLLSATDPVAVVALLKGLGVNKYITAIVDGESVMNDGTAIIAFSLLLPAAKAGALDSSFVMIILKSIRLALLPVLVGPFFGFLQAFWIRRAREGLTKACVTISVTYISYYIAEHFIGTSGVLTLFFEGIFMSYNLPSLFPGREDNAIYCTWEFLVHIGNTMLFSLVGIILVSQAAPTIVPKDIGIILFLYVAMLVARLVMLEALLPVLNRFSYKLSHKAALLLVHAGLRGGVAATLALAVAIEGLEEGMEMLKITCGVVLLTLLVNATTADYAVGFLGFKNKERYRLAQVEYALEYLLSTQNRALEDIKKDPKYRNANWLSVEKFVQQFHENPFGDKDAAGDLSDDTMVNQLVMTAFKTFLWRQRDEEVISESVMVELAEEVALHLEKGTLLDIRELQLYHRQGEGSGSPASVTPTTTVAATTSLSTAMTAGAATEVTISNRDGSRYRPQGNASGGGGASSVPSRGLRRPNSAVGLSSTTSPSRTPRIASLLFEEMLPSVLNQDEEEEEGHTGHVALSVTRSLDTMDADPSVVAAHQETEQRLESDADTTIHSLMRRLLPRWVVLAERTVFSKNYFATAHRRALENAFMTILAILKCLTALTAAKHRFVRTEAQARRIDKWLTSQLRSTDAVIRFFYKNFPAATNNVASSRAVVSVANSLQSALHTLHLDLGLNLHVTAILEESIAHMRASNPPVWDNDVPTKESDLVRRAVQASMLGRGLRRAEIQAISTMGLVKKLYEGDIITLPDNAFVIVVFGSLRAIHGRWSTLTAAELMKSFGDMMGLDSFLLQKSARKEQQRQWRVISTDATVLFISFNSIKPFLMERSLRSVKALWRAAASEVIYPTLQDMITTPDSDAMNQRELLLSLIVQGTPIIGPEAANSFDWSSEFHLCFYLSGTDSSGLFTHDSPPSFVSSFFVSQLHWASTDSVLYVVPVTVNEGGYMPRRSATSAASDAGSAREEPAHTTSVVMHNGGAAAGAKGRHPAPPGRGHLACPETPLPTATEAATWVLAQVLQGQVPEELSDESDSDSSHIHFLRSPQLENNSSIMQTRSFTHLTMHDDAACDHTNTSIFQDLTAFATPVPYVNGVFVEYVSTLEQLCIAAMRYVYRPHDKTTVKHAQHIASLTLEFLLSFGLELALLKRAIRTLHFTPEQRAQLEAVDGGFLSHNDADAEFQSHVVTWSRQAALTGKYHLKVLVVEMNTFANKRFPSFVKTLRLVADWFPSLRDVDDVESLYAMSTDEQNRSGEK